MLEKFVVAKKLKKTFCGFPDFSRKKIKLLINVNHSKRFLAVEASLV